MKINKLITKVNRYTGRNGNSIKYIVIHYVGATGSAYNNCKYFYDVDRSASAHYFVGHDGEIWQCVNDTDSAWHCGGGRQTSQGGLYLGKCTNYNSIGIEMCVNYANGSWVYNDATINSTADLVKYLMNKYNINASHVIRHFDVNGKLCPANYTTDSSWKALHTKLTTSTSNSLEPYSGYVEVTYGGSDGVEVHHSPTFNGNVSAIVKKGEVFTVVGRILVEGVYMYKLKSGGYITSSSKYVSYRKTLH